jgi:hypothetical protein
VFLGSGLGPSGRPGMTFLGKKIFSQAPAPGQALRKPQRGCLEGRTVPTQPSFNSRTRSKAGVRASLVRGYRP